MWRIWCLDDDKQDAKQTFTLAGKPILCVQILADVTQLMLLEKTLNVSKVTRTVIMNNPEYFLGIL